MNILTVGVGKQYATHVEACKAMVAGDLILSDPGLYPGDMIATRPDQPGVTFRCAVPNQRARLFCDPKSLAYGNLVFPNYNATYAQKGIAVVNSDNITIDGLDFIGAFSKYVVNAAGIRHNGGRNLTVLNGECSGGDNGILGSEVEDHGTPEYDGGNVTLDNMLFQQNGKRGGGQAHNYYFGRVDTFKLTRSVSKRAEVGHLGKSRAHRSIITDNHFDDGDGWASMQLDIDGGEAIVLRNRFTKRPMKRPGVTLVGVNLYNFIYYYVQHADSDFYSFIARENMFECQLPIQGTLIRVDDRIIPPNTVWDGTSRVALKVDVSDNTYIVGSTPLTYETNKFALPAGAIQVRNIRKFPQDGFGMLTPTSHSGGTPAPGAPPAPAPAPEAETDPGSLPADSTDYKTLYDTTKHELDLSKEAIVQLQNEARVAAQTNTDLDIALHDTLDKLAALKITLNQTKAVLQDIANVAANQFHVLGG